MIDILAIIAVICAFMVKGMCGFANTLVFSTMLSFTSNNITITPVELLVSFPSNIYIAWKERKEISYKIWLPLAAYVLIGILPGLLFLKMGDTRHLKVLFGFIVALLGVEMFLRERQKEPKKTSKTILAVIGIISGILCGLFGIGAFLVAYITRTTKNQSQFKGNLCVVFLVENIFRIILYTASGILHLAIIKQAVVLLPFMIIGLTGGTLLAKKVSEKRLKKAVILLLILSGVSLVANNMIN